MGDESCSSSAESELEFDSADDELLHCSRNGDVARIRQLLERKDGDDDVDINCKGSQKANRGWTPLHLAAYFGHDEVVKLLLEHGSEVNAINGTGDTSLHKAALTNREAVVTVLLQHEADVSIVNCEGHTAKQLASSDDVIRLIEAAENHESKKLEQEFLEAAAAGQTDQLEKLLQRAKPPSLTCSDSYGNTALHISALRGKENVIVFLLQHGVNTNMKNNNGQTAADMTQVHQIKQLLGVEPRQAFQIQPQKIEGQLLKKSRIFGFRPVWAILDKGVLSYYENRGNAVTGRKRKGMKYLDEAKVFVSNKDGLDFKISFSDGTSHILSIDPVNGAEVTKQKWLNALKEHIEYSTHYIHSCEAVSEYDSDKVSLGTLHDALKTAEAHQQLLTEKITKISESLQQSNDASPAKPNLIQKGLESVLESSKDVCESLNQCMILFQQQEELRELELKEEREKCRVLQDSLHALATEHHELERSISTRRLSRTYDTEDDEFYDCDKDDDDEEDGVVQRFGSPDTFKSFQESFADAISVSISDSSYSAGQYRTTLPVPMFSRNDFSFWSILKQCIGKELSKITMPVIFNEPLSFLQRISEYMEYCYLLEKACQTDDPVERMQYVAAFAVSAVSNNWERIGKPFNPLLGETFELDRPDMGFRLIAEQVSHHPPVSAFHVESQSYRFHGSLNPKIKFWGKSVEVNPKGMMTLELLNYNETYTWHNVNCSVHNVIVGKLWVELTGTVELLNHSTKVKAVLNFKEGGWFGKDLHKVEGFIYDSEKKKLKALYGNWVLSLFACDAEAYENHIKHAATSSSTISPNNAASKANGSSIPVSSEDDISEDLPSPLSAYELEIPEQQCLWRATPRPPDSEQYFAFTLFAMSLNELKEGMSLKLPSTDARLRPDIRLLEEGKIDSAADEKNRLEEQQRAARKDRKKKGEEWDPRWFRYAPHPTTGREDWLFTEEYWDRNWSRSPSIF